MPGKYMRGALVQFMQTFLLPLPNVIIFQYNPESMTHTWTQPEAAPAAAGAQSSNPLAVKGMPGESFSFTIAMDAGDMIADGSVVQQGIATVTGIYSRLAALEMLLYPVPQGTPGLLGSVSASISVTGGISLSGGAGGGTPRPIPALQVPTVLFVWGPGRILPVRVTQLNITERLYDPLLNPTHAEATIGLRVLTPQELDADQDLLAGVAKAAYVYSQALRQALAVVNLENSVESIIGMLPI